MTKLLFPKVINPKYRPQSEDKTPLADAIDFNRLRQLTATQRWQMGISLTRWAKKMLSLRGMKQANPTGYPELFSKAILASKWLPILIPNNDSSMWIFDPSEIARLLHPILESLGILKARGALLETDYLQRWSQKLGITEDLERAIEEASF